MTTVRRWIPIAAALAALVAAPFVARAQSDSAAAKPEAPAPAAAAPAPSTSQTAAQPGTRDECMTCHLDQDSPEAIAYKHDIHRERGVTCADCHGGDPHSDDQDAAMNKAKGFIGVPKKQKIPLLCGSCHGAQESGFTSRYKLKNVLADYHGSAHERSLEANPNGAQCISCHGVHGIVSVTDPKSPVHPSRVVDTCAKCHGDARYMRDFNPSLPVDQKEKYLTSIHGQRHAKGDWKVATCVSCHSNHNVQQVKDPRSPVYPTQIPATCARCHANEKYMAGYDIPTTQYRDYKESVHGVALLKKSDLNAPACNSCHGNHGAAPPGVASVIAVCGQCHQSNEELYQKSPHQAVFAGKKLPGCVVCHSNHGVKPTSDAMVAFVKPSPCADCHRNDPSDKAAPAMLRIRGLLDSLTAGQKEAEAILERAENLGMDVSDAQYSLKDVNQARVKARVAIHSFEEKEFEEAARPGIVVAATAHAAGEEAIKEHRFRRQGLVVSTLIVTLAALLLWLKIRQIERRQRGEIV
ncbi:MAG TPA: cytochrome c3 family protein [Candidatus Eisenbacteria bacterium]|nr:cytochrome c3 family protein [Candidatus Eisenbacteria bacterium]